MRVMVIVKASKDSEAGNMPDAKLLTEMGNFNEELVKARDHAGRRMDSVRVRWGSASGSRGRIGP